MSSSIWFYIASLLMVISGLSATLFAFLYSLVPWYSTKLGRSIMSLTCGVALALNSNFVFRNWFYEERFAWDLVNTIAFTIISISLIAMSFIVFELSHLDDDKPEDDKKEVDE